MSGAPTPNFVFRGHQAAVHAVTFFRNNERLATGDSTGFVVLWELMTLRAKVVWRAHENAILGIRGWGNDKIITHGRDYRLIVWKLAQQDEDGLSAALPLDGSSVTRPCPWMLHSLQVNTMNFCSFAACPLQDSGYATSLGLAPEILVAVPNTLASEAIDIYALPSEKRTHTVKPGSANGMAMSLSVFHHQTNLTVIGAFENGYASVHQLRPTGDWILTYRTQAHSQPVLSLDVRPDLGCFFTSGADAIVAKHPIPTRQQEVPEAFERSERGVVEEVDDASPSPSLPSQAVKDQDGEHQHIPSSTVLQAWHHPKKVVNTKHAGQQGLRVRSDGGIFATAGWDAKVRVYSCKTMKQLAVLKWFKDSVYAVAFSDVDPDPSQKTADAEEGHDANNGPDLAVSVSRMSVMDRRKHRVQTAHWVAASGKDGRVSLWNIY